MTATRPFLSGANEEFEMTDISSPDFPRHRDPVLEAKAAMTDFTNDFRAFQSRIETKMKTQDDRISLLDRKAQGRPAIATAASEATPHRKAIAAYLRGGDESGLRAVTTERKGLTTDTVADGGFLIDRQTSDRIATVLRGGASLRAVANVVTIEAGSYDVLVDHSELVTGWATETAAAIETAASQVERISIPLHELAAMPKASQRLLDDAAFDLEGWLADTIAEKFSRAENAAFVGGDGIDKPTGFLSYPGVPADAWVWGSLGYVTTGAAGDFNPAEPADAIVDLVYSLGARYRANAVFAMNSKTAGTVRKMKDADGRFLWSESISADQPARLMGYRVVTCEDMPDIAPDAAAIAFGDFHAGYTVAQRADMRILRDPYSAKPHVQFYASVRVGGDVTDFAAIKLLKFAVN